MRCPNEKLVKFPDTSTGLPKGLTVPCGKCYACRYNRTQQWVDRLEMEARTHPRPPFFVTLTYSDEHLPRTSSGVGQLDPKEVQTFLKRLRKELHPDRIRYVYIGEYGGRTHRPHYHFILFGCSLTALQLQSVFERKWQRGHARVSSVTPKRLAYVASFHINAHEAPTGLVRPFARYSNRPGIGYGYCEDFALSAPHRREVPDLQYIRLNGSRRPLPTYIRTKLYPDGYPLPLDIQPLPYYLAERYPGMLFHEARQYLRDYHSRKLKRQLEKHGKYIQQDAS